MPEFGSRYPDWAEAGARLLVNTELRFSNALWQHQGDNFVGPAENTCVVEVTAGPSTVVTLDGAAEVHFSNGGWCVQEDNTNSLKRPGSKQKLVFWLDCPSGATKSNTCISPGSRIYFTTDIWNDPEHLAQIKAEYQAEQAKYQQSRKALERAAFQWRNGTLNPLQRVLAFREHVAAQERWELSKGVVRYIELELPTDKTVKAPNGVELGESGQMYEKWQKWPLVAPEYLQLGSFTLDV